LTRRKGGNQDKSRLEAGGPKKETCEQTKIRTAASNAVVLTPPPGNRKVEGRFPAAGGERAISGRR
jgi:hypothetical protein